MNNSRFNSSDQDEIFLQNFDSSVQKQDIFANLCKLQQENMQNANKLLLKEQMYEEQLSKKSQNNESRYHSKSKQRKKIFYRDKMAELMKPGEYIKQEYNYITYNQIQPNKIPISRQEQLKRNRQSAKNSRQRKKQYVVALQQKNDENLRLIQQLSYKLQQVTLQRDRLKEYNHQEIKNFLKSQAQAYEKLEGIIRNTNARNDEIKTHIFEMLQKFGTSGTSRISVMNYYMNQIIEDMISDIQKYFLNSSSFSQSFNSLQLKPIDLDVMRILDLDVTKINYIMQRYKDRFNKEATVYKDLTQQLYRVFTSIKNQGKIIQLVFMDMIKELDFKKIGELILYFEENRFCREVKRVRKQWIEQLKTGETVIETIRKQAKHQ